METVHCFILFPDHGKNNILKVFEQNFLDFKKKFRVETNDKSETETWKRLAVMNWRKPFPRCFTYIIIYLFYSIQYLVI